MTTLGIEVSKATLALALWQDGAARVLEPVANTPDGWETLARVLAASLPAEALASLTVVLEPTGGYEAGVALWAYQRGWPVSRPNPRQVREWARREARRAKTDRQDALVLARSGAERALPTWQPLPEEISTLEAWLQRRADLEGLLRQERNRQQQMQVRPTVPPGVLASLDRLIRQVEAELAEVEQAIATHLAQHDTLRATCARLRSVPGIGPKNGLPLFVLLSRWSGLTAGQGTSRGLVASVGLDPQPYDSGSSIHRRASISRQGNGAVRQALYMGALGALRGHNPVRVFYQRLVGRGKAKKLALVAAARKVLVWAWAVFQSGASFEAATLAASTLDF